MASTDSISTIESRDTRDRDPGSLRIRSTYSEPSSFVVQLRQGAGVKEISWQLALVPLSADGVGKRPRNLGESLSGVIPRHRITGGCGDEDHLRYATSLEGSFQERRSRESAKLRTYGEETASRI